MLRPMLCVIACLAFAIGCGQRSQSDKGEKESGKEQKVGGFVITDKGEKESGKEQKVGGFVITDKAKDSLSKVPIKVYELLTTTLKSGTLVQAEYMGQHRIGFSGAGFTPGTSNDWSGFYVGKAAGFQQADEEIKLRSFTVRAVVSYDGVYECDTKEATAGEIKLLKERGYIK